MKRAPTLSVNDLHSQAAEFVSNAVIRRPGVPPEILADEIADESEAEQAEFARQFGRMLTVGFYSRAIRAELAKQRRVNVPEQFAHLPLRIRLPDNTMVRLDRMTYSHARAYYFALGRKLDDRKANDVKRAEAKILMDALAKKQRGITAGQVLGFDFGDANKGKR